MNHLGVSLTIMRDGEEIEPTADVMTSIIGATYLYHAGGGCSGHTDSHVHMALHLPGQYTPPTAVECPTCSAEVIDQAKHDAAEHPPPSTTECPTCSAAVYDQAKHDAQAHPPEPAPEEPPQ